jgi:ubiquinol-cytochrome c reductase iron-sulfur subunit
MSKDEIDKGKRRFLLTATGLLGGIGVVVTAMPFIASWFPSARAKAAAAPVEVDISDIEPGQLKIAEWRGNPVWILRRTQEIIDQLSKHDNLLRDPESNVDQQPDYAQNVYRSRRPEYLVLIGICTHLGCSPKYCGGTIASGEENLMEEGCPSLAALGGDWPGGFYCPCHGSKFDLSGRVFKGVPAPINLAIPPYMFLDDKTIIIGVDEETPISV